MTLWQWRMRIVVALSGLLGGGVPALAQEYRLGPQDQLQVRVYDLRTGTGEAYQWTAFTGDFAVGASGKVSLPLIGELQASDRTTSDLAKSISERLQSKVGLAQRPDASVQVSKYRPFYVMGAVEKPGEYEYRPGLTVLQAVSTSGGLSRLQGDALMNYAREALVSRGDLRVLAADRLQLLARQARLDAEIRNADGVTFPDLLLADPKDQTIARILREERLLFNAHRDTLRSQSDALAKGKDLLQHEIKLLDEKDLALGRQLDLNRKELDQVSGLVAKGLTVLPRQLEVQRTMTQFESDRLDVQLAKMRASEGITKADQDVLELTNKARNDALQEATEVRNRLTEAAEKIDTSQSLLFHSEVRAPASLSENAMRIGMPDYFLTRRVDGKSETRPAEEGDLVQPGDVLRIEPKVPPAMTGEADQPTSRSTMRY